MSGQINRGSNLGEIIYNIASDTEYKKFLEIGTWNGQGSTKCFIDGLLTRNDDYSFISLESSKDFYEKAVRFNQTFLNNKIKIIHGRIIDNEELIYREIQGHKKTWLDNDILNYKECKNVWNEINNLYDVLLLDGGEFSTYAEFQKLKDLISILILDDTNEIKNTKVLQYIKQNSDNWEIIKESQERNGYAIYKRIHTDK
jgi:hypothetical protein